MFLLDLLVANRLYTFVLIFFRVRTSLYKLFAILLYIIFLRKYFIATQLLKIILIFVDILSTRERKTLINYYYSLYIFATIIQEFSNFTSILFDLFTNMFLKIRILIEFINY